jgi:hypothetical protein
MSISIRRFGQSIGATTVSGMAQALGLVSRPLSVRDMIQRFGTPLQPMNLTLGWVVHSRLVKHSPSSSNVPVNIDGGISLGWDDPGKDSQRAATSWALHFRKGNGQEQIFTIVRSPGFGTSVDFDFSYSWSVVPTNEFGVGVSSTVFSFKAQSSPAPQPTPTPIPPTPTPTRKALSKLSYFNCRQDQHTLFIWVRDLSAPGTPFGLVATMPTQTNSSGACPFDDDGHAVDSVVILDRLGAERGLRFEDKHFYQIAIVDPELQTCGGRNDPEQDNCLLQDQPFIVQADLNGDELTLMIAATIAPVPL